jgi:mannose-6-phosphate isomerase-like protein (cupin superfamily)
MKLEAKSIFNTENYKWGNNCDGWHLLKSDRLSVIQEKMPKDSSEQLHYHQYSQQLFYILSGTAHFNIEGETVIVNAGESIHIPNLIQHKIYNTEEEELTFLVISEPKSHGDRINC